MTKRLVTDQFWQDNFGQLVPQAIAVLNAPPVVGQNHHDAKILSALIIGLADVHYRLQNQPEPPKIITP